MGNRASQVGLTLIYQAEAKSNLFTYGFDEVLGVHQGTGATIVLLKGAWDDLDTCSGVDLDLLSVAVLREVDSVVGVIGDLLTVTRASFSATVLVLRTSRPHGSRL